MCQLAKHCGKVHRVLGCKQARFIKTALTDISRSLTFLLLFIHSSLLKHVVLFYDFNAGRKHIRATFVHFPTLYFSAPSTIVKTDFKPNFNTSEQCRL